MANKKDKKGFMSKFNFQGFKYESEAGKKVKKSKLDPIRKLLQPLLDRANRAISRLMQSGEAQYSQAILEAQHSLSRAQGINQDTLFNLDDKTRYRDLIREGNRLEAFLSHPEVEPKVAKYNREYGANLSFHDTSIHDSQDQDRVKLALRIYRDIASTEVSAIGSEAFGSDNLLNLIYDELEGYYPGMDEDSESILADRVRMIAFDALDDYRENVMMGFLSGNPPIKTENTDYGIVQELKKSTSVDDFLKKHKKFTENDW